MEMEMEMEMDTRQPAVEAADLRALTRRPRRRLVPRALALALLAVTLPLGRLITTAQPAAAATGPRPTLTCPSGLAHSHHLLLSDRRPAAPPATARPGASVAARVD